MECMMKRRTKLLSWSWAGSVMNQTASIRRYWDIHMKNGWSLWFFIWIWSWTFFLPTCHTGPKWTVGAGQSCCSGSSWGDGCRLRNTMICPNFAADPFGVTHWTWPICHIYFDPCHVKLRSWKSIDWYQSCGVYILVNSWRVQTFGFCCTGYADWSTGLCVFRNRALDF